MKNSLRVFVSASATTGLVLLVTSSFTIALAFGALVAGAVFIALKNRSAHSESHLIAA
jgi:uncharacterized membrane protein YozB (DUF420 family)